jgi:Ca2+-binding RTX toxin-like protein
MFVVGGLTPGVVSRYSVVARNSAGTAASPWVACAPARAVLKDNALVIFGTHKGDNIVVGQTNDRIAIKNLRILYNGKLEKDVYSGLVGEIRVYGGRANDTIELDTGKQPIYARAEVEGGPGNDTISGVQGGSNLIHGGEDNDRITGGNNDDKLYGESGDDQLFGLNGNDQLYGDYGNDWLEAGSVQEVADFGPNPYGLDKDYNAHQWAISGATYDDIRQGRIGNCSFLAALSSLALRGVDLESRIRYLGDFIYEVKLYDLKGHLAPQRVRFNGFGNNRDPEPAAAGEFWTVLYRRAFLKVYGAIDDGLPLTQPLTVLTGKPSTFRPLKDTDPAANASVFNEMEEAIRAARNVTTATPAKGFLTVELVYKHAYTVVSVQRDPAGQPESVVVRNPWGRDGGSAPSGNPDDGLIALSWDVFQRDMAGVCIN